MLRDVNSMRLYRVDGQDGHWSEVVSQTEAKTTSESVSGSERKRREAVWELFTSQCVFLFDHLMVLKHVRRRAC